METAHYYSTSLHWQHDRKGILSSSVLDSSIEVATPPEFPKGMAGIWSPEHFFVAAVNSCLMTTFLAVAENSKLEFAHFESDATGKLEKVDGKFMISEIILKPVLTITKESDRERAERILQKSESLCLISNSIKSQVVFQPEIIVTETVPV